MVLIRARERNKKQFAPARVLAKSQPDGKAVASTSASTTRAEVPSVIRSAWSLSPVKVKKPYPAHRHRAEGAATLEERAQDPQFAVEREKMKAVENLAGVADEVEDAATLYEWRAQEHAYQPRSMRWYVALAVGVTVAAGLLAFLGNFLGAVAVALVGGLIYFLAQRGADEVRYRIMVDGVAVNERLYQFQDLDVFNIVYEPGITKTVIIRSKRMLAPLIQMEIGSADPVEIRDVLLEFLKEDTSLQEPVTDSWARKFGF